MGGCGIIGAHVNIFFLRAGEVFNPGKLEGNKDLKKKKDEKKELNLTLRLSVNFSLA